MKRYSQKVVYIKGGKRERVRWSDVRVNTEKPEKERSGRDVR